MGFNLYDKAIHKKCDDENILISVGVISMFFQSKINNLLLSRLLVFISLSEHNQVISNVVRNNIEIGDFYFLISNLFNSLVCFRTDQNMKPY